MKNATFVFLVTALILSMAACDVETDPDMQVEDETTPTIVDEGPDRHLTYHANEIDWQPGPPSVEEGIEVAVLEGDPSEEGVFTLRLRIPDEGFIAPHWHPNVERVTVISGTFLLGSGEEMDREDVTRLEPGSYTSMPPEMVHYAIAEGETVIQLTSVGPWIINYVNPEEDDPRERNR